MGLQIPINIFFSFTYYRLCKALHSRYHGLLAPNSKHRSKIVPTYAEVPQSKEDPPPPERPSRISWVVLLKRVFQLDLAQCPDCGGEVKFIAAIVKKSVIAKILEHLKLPVDPPRFAPARSPP
jgi:hypothetical protein